jgi:YtkA-like
MSRTLYLTTLLAATLAACAAPPRDLDLSLRQPSAQGRYVVQIEPPAAAPAINQIHSWQIRLSAPDGAPVRNARIAVDGGMPQHGHGLPTRPQVTRELAPGTYAIEGMKFSMTGWWEIKLAIQAAEGADSVVFNTVVGAAGPAR